MRSSQIMVKELVPYVFAWISSSRMRSFARSNWRVRADPSIDCLKKDAFAATFQSAKEHTQGQCVISKAYSPKLKSSRSLPKSLVAGADYHRFFRSIAELCLQMWPCSHTNGIQPHMQGLLLRAHRFALNHGPYLGNNK
jgi:hypothetical protein